MKKSDRDDTTDLGALFFLKKEPRHSFRVFCFRIRSTDRLERYCKISGVGGGGGDESCSLECKVCIIMDVWMETE